MGIIPDIASNVLYEQYAESEISRMNQISRAWLAYNGDLPKVIKVGAGKVDDNIVVNFCKIVVDKGVSALFGKSIDIDVDTENIERNDVEKYLDAVFEFNKKDILLQRWATNGAVCGHAFIKIVVDPAYEYPRLIVLDPSNVRVYVEEEDFTQPYKYIIQWNGFDRRYSPPKPAVHRQEIEKSENGLTWVIVDKINTPARAGGDIGWETLLTTTWNYPFSPIIDNQNLPTANEFWGMADLEADLIDMQQSLNYAVSNVNRMLRIHADPKLWTQGLTTDQQKQINIDSRGIINIPGPNGSLHVLEAKGDLEHAVGFYVKLREAFHEMAHVPEVSTGSVDKIGPLAGVALKILYAPLSERTEQKQKTYGYPLRELCRRLIILGNQTLAQEQVITIGWPEVVPTDDYQAAQTAEILERLGVSKYTLIKRLGFNPESEKKRKDDESNDAIEAQQRLVTMMQGASVERNTNDSTQGANNNPVNAQDQSQE